MVAAVQRCLKILILFAIYVLGKTDIMNQKTCFSKLQVFFFFFFL
jgi:hypothetical protein